MQHIIINQKQCRHLNFNINCKSELSTIFAKFNEIDIPDLKISKDLFLHSLIELVNNSISAHNEKNISAPVQIRFSIENEDLQIIIRDKGKGFNPEDLPYDLNDPVSLIDINGKNFQDYREKYNYKRFGTGLFNAKKTFDEFDLYFIDDSGAKTAYDSMMKDGTVINLLLKGR